MEPGTVFAGFVLYMGGFHLLWQASDRLSKWWTKNKDTSTLARKQRVKRDDWYVFFHQSDLTGPTRPQKPHSGRSKREKSTDNNLPKKRRPRARAR